MIVSTWNLQGKNYDNAFSTFAEAKNRMWYNNIDVLCLQEVGNLFNAYPNRTWERPLAGFELYSIDDVIRTESRGAEIKIYYASWGEGNKRCSLAILVRKALNPRAPAIITVGNLRPAIGVVIGMTNMAVYTIHAPSGNATFANVYLDKVLNEIRKLRLTYGINNIILEGDFNDTPDGTIPIALNYGYRTYPPLINNLYDITWHNEHGGSCLDYCVASTPPNCVRVHNENNAFSDHYQVTYNFPIQP